MLQRTEKLSTWHFVYIVKQTGPMVQSGCTRPTVRRAGFTPKSPKSFPVTISPRAGREWSVRVISAAEGR